MFEWLFLLNLASSCFMTGVIWLIQVVQYPSFRLIEPDPVHFAEIHLFHVRKISFVVIPVMLIEIASSMLLVIIYEKMFQVNLAGLIMVVLIWIITFTVQLPVHNKLQEGPDRENVEKLIAGNWLRTVLWSLKSVITAFGISYFMIS